MGMAMATRSMLFRIDVWHGRAKKAPKSSGLKVSRRLGGSRFFTLVSSSRIWPGCMSWRLIFPCRQLETMLMVSWMAAAISIWSLGSTGQVGQRREEKKNIFVHNMTTAKGDLYPQVWIQKHEAGVILSPKLKLNIIIFCTCNTWLVSNKVHFTCQGQNFWIVGAKILFFIFLLLQCDL